MNIYGAPIGTLACNVAVVICNFYFLTKKTHFVLPIKKTCVAPTVAAFVAVILGGALNLVLSRLVGAVSLLTIISIGCVALVYVALSCAFGIIKKEDFGFEK